MMRSALNLSGDGFIVLHRTGSYRKFGTPDHGDFRKARGWICNRGKNSSQEMVQGLYALRSPSAMGQAWLACYLLNAQAFARVLTASQYRPGLLHSFLARLRHAA